MEGQGVDITECSEKMSRKMSRKPRSHQLAGKEAGSSTGVSVFMGAEKEKAGLSCPLMPSQVQLLFKPFHCKSWVCVHSLESNNNRKTIEIMKSVFQCFHFTDEKSES